MRPWAALVLCAFLGSACTQSPSPSSSQPRSVFVIVMENHSFDQAASAPFTSSLVAKYGVAENYHAVAHPSVPNYLALTSGSTWGMRDDGCADNRVLTLVVAPGMGHKSSQKNYTHYSLLATIEDLLGVGRLGEAANATPMTDLIQ